MKKCPALCLVLFLFVATASPSTAQDGAFDFSNPWAHTTGGLGSILSAPGVPDLNRINNLSRLMDFAGAGGNDPSGSGDFFNRFLDLHVAGNGQSSSPAPPFDLLETLETTKDLSVRAHMAPGTGLGDISVSSNGDLLTINVQKTVMNEETGEDYRHVEWSRESFTRIAPLPGEVESQEMTTNYEDDVLTVTFPKNQ